MASNQLSQEQLAIINGIIQREAKKIAEDVYNTKATQYGVPKTSFHTHNGVDSPTIQTIANNLSIIGTLTTTGAITAGNGATGTFTAAGHTLTITAGIITNIT